MSASRTVIDPSGPRSRCTNQNRSATTSPSGDTGGAGHAPPHDGVAAAVRSPKAIRTAPTDASATSRAGRRSAAHAEGLDTATAQRPKAAHAALTCVLMPPFLRTRA
ncbi:hypothetical protein GCM10009830_42110 [Glycomyces endophyticus]|uniref:Uncharacterized protein n=1 Tax=Glycomyces endophyticus TaxID=480996 RepID=A0ABN2HM11_9ACTN